MRLTPRARELRPSLTEALNSMRRLVAVPKPFSPKRERRVLRLAAADYTTTILLSRWTARLREQAPGVSVEVQQIDAGSIEPLANGELDLAIAPRIAAVGLDQFVARKIVEDELVCVVRQGHPSAAARLTLRAYLKLEHVMVGSALPTVSAVDVALHAHREARVLAVKVPSVLSALMLVASSDFATTTYARILPHMHAPLVARPLPFEVEPLELFLMWHPRENANPFHRWLRQDLIDYAREHLGSPGSGESRRTRARSVLTR